MGSEEKEITQEETTAERIAARGWVMLKELVATVAEFEEAASKLSDLLESFDLSDVPYSDRNLNHIPIGDKVKVAKFLIRVLSTSPVRSAE